MSITIQQLRANEAMAKIDGARTPQERHDACAEGFTVKADLETQRDDAAAIALFKSARPQNAAGMYSNPAQSST